MQKHHVSFQTINCLIGTRAQLIKMAPIFLELERQAIDYRILLTGQHSITIDELLREFGVKQSPIYLYEGPEVSGFGRVIPWFSSCLLKLLQSKEWFNAPKAPLLIHGDTFSTLLGAIAGRLKNQKVVHVESGLRSFNWFNPFPEEITRYLVFRMTDLACCPDEWSEGNLNGFSAKTLITNGNTLIDSLRLATAKKQTVTHSLSEAEYCVASIHRFENIFNKPTLTKVVELLETAALKTRVVFVLHPATELSLKKYQLHDRLANNPRFQLIPRMTYFSFIGLLAKSAYVITDGGSNQEELSYLGKPTFLARKATERQEGLGSTVKVGGLSARQLNEFLNEISANRRTVSIPTHSPSTIIVDAIKAL